MANSSNQLSHPLRSEPTSKPAGLHLNNWLRLSHDRGPPNWFVPTPIPPASSPQTISRPPHDQTTKPVPPGATAAYVIKRGEFSSNVVGFVIAGRHGGAET